MADVPMKKLFIALSCLLFGLSAFAQDEPWLQRFVGKNGQEYWAAPGPLYSEVSRADKIAAGYAAARAGGLNAVQTGKVVLADARAVTQTATRFASAANLFSAAKMLAGGPLGIAQLLLSVPSLYDWITGDNAVNIRVNSTRDGVEKKDPKVCSTSPCYGYYTTHSATLQTTQLHACEVEAPLWLAANYPSGTIGAPWVSAANVCSAVVFTGPNGSPKNYTYTAGYPLYSSSVAPLPTAWLPATMDDIAPYMTPRDPAPAYLNQIADAGGSVSVSPVSVTSVLPAELPNYTFTVDYPSPYDKVSTVMATGNVYSLAANTPTVTATSTSTALVYPGNQISSGSLPSNITVPSPSPLTVPTTSTSVSTYDQPADQTTTVTTTKQDAAQQVSTTTSLTTITNTTNTSTVNISNVTTVVTNNVTKNVPLLPTVTKTDLNKRPDPSPAVDPCEKNPTRVGCLDVGTAPMSDPMVKKKTDVTITAIAFTSSSSCPVPLGFTVIGHNYNVSYQPLCDRLAVLKYLFLAMAAFVASWVLASLFKV